MTNSDHRPGSYLYTCSSFEVSLNIEVREEEEEHDGVASNPPDEDTGVFALGEAKLEKEGRQVSRSKFCIW